MRSFAGPLHQQVAEHLRNWLTAGSFEANQMLPPETELAEMFAVSVGTMRKAMDRLRAEKLIQRKQGRGTFFTPGRAVDRTSSFGHFTAGGIPLETTYEEIGSETGISTDEELKALGLPRPQMVIRLHRRGYCSGFVEFRERVVVPEALFRDLLERSAEERASLHQLFQAHYRIQVASVEQLISVAAPELHGKSRAPRGSLEPVLIVERLARDTEDRLVEWSRAEISLRRSQYAIRSA